MQARNYSYPIDEEWTSDELKIVIRLFNRVEDAYEIGVNRQKLLSAYQAFQQTLNSRSYEKRLSRQFEQVSGYSIYLAVKEAQSTSQNTIRMGD